MDVYVIIIFHSDGSCQVTVCAAKKDQTWIKKYEDKAICLNELISVGLITHAQMADEQASNFANRDRMFMVESKIAGEVLRVAQFVEQKKEYVN